MINCCHPFIADPAVALLQEWATKRQRQSRAEGTWQNHRSAVTTYLAFCSQVGLNPVKAHHSMICVFIEYLNQHIKAPASIVNNISHIRIFVRLTGHPSDQMDHPRVGRALEALKRNKAYVPNIKLPVPMGVLRQVLQALDASPEHKIVRAALLIQFYGALRKGEVTPPSVRQFSPTVHLTRNDVVFHKDGVRIQIKSAKNMQLTSQRRTINLAQTADPTLCVQQALKAAIEIAPTQSLLDPLLMFPDSRSAVPVTYIEKVWRQELERMGLGKSAFTLHGLRKAAATEAYDAGMTELDIQKYGGWRSTAHRTYICRTKTRGVNKSLINSLKSKK